jgi:hypothetical protein
MIAWTDVEHIDGELVELGLHRGGKREPTLAEKKQFLAKLKALRPGWKQAWAAKFRERYGPWLSSVFATRCGLNANFKRKPLGSESLSKQLVFAPGGADMPPVSFGPRRKADEFPCLPPRRRPLHDADARRNRRARYSSRRRRPAGSGPPTGSMAVRKRGRGHHPARSRGAAR